MEGRARRGRSCSVYRAAFVHEMSCGMIGRRAARCFSFY